MTEFSFPWSCTVAGDGGASSYSLAIVEDTNKFLSNITPDTAGVIYWTQSPYSGLLEPTNPAGSTVRIASGVGIVEGWVYTNDANVDFDINASPGNINATDIIVLQRVAASQTVRLARIGGAVSSKAVLTQTAATWEVPIVDVVLDGAGNFSSISDARVLATPSGTAVKLGVFTSAGGSATATFSSIAPLFSHLLLKGRIRGTTAAASVALQMTFNSDGGANYDWIAHTANSAGTLSETDAAADTSIGNMKTTAANGTTDYYDSFEILIPFYRLTTGYKNALSKNTFFGDGAAFEITQGAAWWRNTGAITRIDIAVAAGNFADGSSITLMGLI